jgi:hypothetical protein
MHAHFTAPRRVRAVLGGLLLGCLGGGFFAGICLLATCVARAAHAADAGLRVPSREALIGAWRLIGIELSTRDGRRPDPFFEAGSTGLIVYDPSGWMSVQISGPQRMAWYIPGSRPPAAKQRDLRLKAAAYDSYYAYFGTWQYDEQSAVMIHHVKSSVIPAEVGLDYSQQIRIDGNRITFVGHVLEHGEDITRTKIWERVGELHR